MNWGDWNWIIKIEWGILIFVVLFCCDVVLNVVGLGCDFLIYVVIDMVSE